MSVMTNQKLATALTQRILSKVRDVIAYFKKMLKQWGGQGNSLFPLECDNGGHHITREE